MHHIKRRIEITTVKEQSVIVRPVSVCAYRWCAACGTPANMVTPDQAATIAQVFMRTIFQWVESGRLHFEDTADGKLLVCLTSLSAATATSTDAAPIEAIELPPGWREVATDDDVPHSESGYQ